MKNQEKYLISIIGKQVIDGEGNKIEVVTGGNYMMKNDRSYIEYREYDENDPNNCSENLIKVADNTVTITRKGTFSSLLTLEKGKRHQCVYQTFAGDFSIGIYTLLMENTLNADGGTLKVCYTIDFDSGLVSENSFKIKVEKKQNL